MNPTLFVLGAGFWFACGQVLHKLRPALMASVDEDNNLVFFAMGFLSLVAEGTFYYLGIIMVSPLF